MANRKITDLVALTAPATGDLLPIVDISEAVAADKNKKITYGELLASAPAGTAAAPSFSFDGDPNSGLYSVGADQVAISTGGTGRLFVDASGNVQVGSQRFYVDNTNGRVGILTSSPQKTLEVAAASDPTIRLNDLRGYTTDIKQGGSVFSLISNDASGPIVLGTNGTERLRITSAGLVGIGTSSPGSALEINAAASTSPFIAKINTAEAARIDSSGRLLVGTTTSTSVGGSSAAVQIQGTAGIPHSLQLTRDDSPILAFGKTSNSGGSTLGAIVFAGLDGTDTNSVGAVIFAAHDGAISTDDLPTRLVFSTTPDGAPSPTERMRITSGGYLKATTTGTQLSTNRHGFRANQSEFVLQVSQDNAAGSGITIDCNSDTTALNALNVYSTSSAGDRLNIRTNGNVVNTNNSYGAISDVKLKENIVDAGFQWDDLKALQVRKYNFKEGQTHTQIGLVAQEVELVSPGLVTESPDRDAEGNDLGTVTKSVNYSVLYMKAVKALQEAMERIETLEAKVAALEAK
jgi:hypothetical protein